MKVTVTHLKAAWPEGTKVGDTVELPGDSLPSWAAGKCVPFAAEEKAEAPAADPKKGKKG